METNETKIAKLRALTADIEQRHAAIHNRLGVSEAEFAGAKAARAKPAVPGSLRSEAFNPRQFSSASVTAIMAANATGKFLFLPDANDADYSDGTADGIPADDDNSTWAHCKRAANHLEQCIDADSELCDRAPMDGSPDHLALAAKHIQEAMEMRARGGHRDLISENSHHQRVRFA